MAIIQINSTILTASHLNSDIATVAAQGIPPPPSGLTDKTRWIQCTLKNETQFPVVFQSTYLSSGRYETRPGDMTTFQQMTFSACNGDNTIATGATGGTAFKVTLDMNHSFDVSFGWAIPYWGAMKAGVRESTNPEDGYTHATDVGNFIDSANTYAGGNTEGRPSTFKFHVLAVPGPQTLFRITQIILS